MKNHKESQDLSAWEASVLSSRKQPKVEDLNAKQVYYVVAGFLTKQSFAVPALSDLEPSEWQCLKMLGKLLTDDQICMVYGHILKKGRDRGFTGKPKHGWFSFAVLKHANKFVEGLE